ncbi:MAG: SCO family protein, partial [Thermoanaerobaculia bacterium]
MLGLLAMASTVLSCTVKTAFHGTVLDPAHEAPEISGLNWDGKPFQLSDLRGKVAIVSFGYTFCPDVCPLTLWKMKDLYSRLGERTSDLAFIFVSVDPGRDTPEKLGDYVRAFDPRF